MENQTYSSFNPSKASAAQDLQKQQQYWSTGNTSMFPQYYPPHAEPAPELSSFSSPFDSNQENYFLSEQNLQPGVSSTPQEAHSSSHARPTTLQNNSSSMNNVSKLTLRALLLLLPGAIFLLFAMILILFSQDGHLSLQWNAKYWFVYLVVSAPMLYIGFKTLSQLPKEEV